MPKDIKDEKNEDDEKLHRTTSWLKRSGSDKGFDKTDKESVASDAKGEVSKKPDLSNQEENQD